MPREEQRPMGRPGGGPPHARNMVREKPKNGMKTLKRLFAYIGSNRYLLLGLMGIMLVITLLNLAGPNLQGRAIDSMSLSGGRLHVDFRQLTLMVALLAGTYVASSLLTYLQGLLSAKLSQTTVRNMRRDLFNKMVKLPISYTDTHRHGDIMSRMTNDVENVSNTVSQSIGSFVSGAITIIGCIVIMLYYSPALTLVSFVSVILSVLATMFMSKYMRKYFLKQQQLLGQLNGHVEEMVTGYKTVVAFNKEADSQQVFNGYSETLKNTAIKAQIFGGIMGPLMNVIGNFGFLLIAAFGGWFALEDLISIGTIQTFILYSKQFTRPINELANLYGQIQTAMAGAERVFEIMDAAEEVDAGTHQLPAENVQGALDFQNITFSYKPGEPVLKGFNLKVEPGQRIAIVGATGSGKTTVVNLLTRFYEVDGGTILLDGVDIRDIPKDQLRQSIAIVLQDTVLFSDSIKTNIAYGKLDAELDDIRRAASTANASRFIEQMPKGYDTELTESGSNLSQGQRQLLSIARAVLADPKILILDEATSSVDTRTEVHIQEAMLALMKNRTSLIIAHRLSTIRDADCIVVIENGVVAESGSHEELLAQKGCYWRLYQNQFAGIAT